MYHLARGSYLLDDPKNNTIDINDQFIHTQFLALVDRGGRVRKIYDSLKKEELDELELEESTGRDCLIAFLWFSRLVRCTCKRAMFNW